MAGNELSENNRQHTFGVLAGMSIKNSWNSMRTTGRITTETEKFAEIDYVSSSMYTASGQGSSTLSSYYGRLEYNFEGIPFQFDHPARRIIGHVPRASMGNISFLFSRLDPFQGEVLFFMDFFQYNQ
jgi:hypothetical protein